MLRRWSRLESIDIKLIKPVHPGDTITFHGKVVAKHPRTKEMSFVDLELYAENQNGDKVAVGKAQAYLPESLVLLSNAVKSSSHFYFWDFMISQSGSFPMKSIVPLGFVGCSQQSCELV
nr:hypothetical protein [Candidatus Sigynarchaeota archaeon]